MSFVALIMALSFRRLYDSTLCYRPIFEGGVIGFIHLLPALLRELCFCIDLEVKLRALGVSTA